MPRTPEFNTQEKIENEKKLKNLKNENDENDDSNYKFFFKKRERKKKQKKRGRNKGFQNLGMVKKCRFLARIFTTG